MKNIYHYIIVTLFFLSGTIAAGTIKGKVTNGTAGFKIPKNTVVELAKYVNKNKDDSFIMKATVDKNGFFSFKNLEPDEQAIYIPSVVYNSVSYSGKQIVITKEKSSHISNIKIYESTKSDSLIYVELQHFLIIPTEGMLEIQEILLLKNDGDRTYTGSIPTGSGKFITAYHKLPKDAIDMQIGFGLMSCCVEPANEGFYDTMEIQPGEKQVSFSYKIKAPEETINFTKKITLPVKEFDVYLFGGQATLSGNKLTKLPDQIVENKVIKKYQALKLKNGDNVTINLAGLSGQPTDWSLIALIGVAGILLLAGIFVYQKQKKEKILVKEYSVDNLDTDDREVILQRIIKLDEDYEAGKLDEAEYLIQRNKLKDKLK